MKRIVNQPIRKALDLTAEALIACRAEHMTIAEIAAHWGLSVSGVNKRLRKLEISRRNTMTPRIKVGIARQHIADVAPRAWFQV